MAEHSWWTSPLEDDNGNLIMVTGREDVEKFRSNPRFCIRVTITLPYESLPDGMPTDAAAELLGNVLEPLQEEFEKDPVAVLTGVYTGGGERTMVFYTASVHIFNKKLNNALAPLPVLPLKIEAENDPEWLEYQEMEELSRIY